MTPEETRLSQQITARFGYEGRHVISTFLLLAEIHEECAAHGFNPVTDPERAYAVLMTKKDSFEDNPFFSQSDDDAKRILCEWLDEYAYIGGVRDWSALYTDCMGQLWDTACFVVPTFIASYLEQRVPDPADCLVIEALKFAPYMTEYIASRPACTFTLTWHRNGEYKLLRRILGERDNVRYVRSDLRDDAPAGRYDLILASCGYEARSGAERSAAVAVLEKILFRLTRGGTLVIMLAQHFTFAGGDRARLRRLIERNYRIDLIAQGDSGYVPDPAFVAKHVLLQITNATPESGHDVHVARFASPPKDSAGFRHRFREKTPFSVAEECTVPQSELAAAGAWDVDHCFYVNDPAVVRYRASSVEKAPLSSVASVARGVSLRSADMSDRGDVAVIEISNIGRRVVLPSSRQSFVSFGAKLSKAKLAPSFLADGDLLITARGSELRTALFRAKILAYDKPCIASANVIVVRPNPARLRGECLKLFFDSEIGRKTLGDLVGGSVLLALSYKGLQNVDVPVPPREVQERVAEVYTTEQAFFHAALTEVNARRACADEAMLCELFGSGRCAEMWSRWQTHVDALKGLSRG